MKRYERKKKNEWRKKKNRAHDEHTHALKTNQIHIDLLTWHNNYLKYGSSMTLREFFWVLNLFGGKKKKAKPNKPNKKQNRNIFRMDIWKWMSVRNRKNNLKKKIANRGKETDWIQIRFVLCYCCNASSKCLLKINTRTSVSLSLSLVNFVFFFCFAFFLRILTKVLWDRRSRIRKETPNGLIMIIMAYLTPTRCTRYTTHKRLLDYYFFCAFWHKREMFDFCALSETLSTVFRMSILSNVPWMECDLFLSLFFLCPDLMHL